MFVGLLPAAAAGASLALLSSAHCAAMCGPVALSARVRGGPQATLAYYAGRLVTYTVLGALAGSFGRVLMLGTWARWAEAVLALALAESLLHAGLRLLRRGASPTAAPALVPLRKKPPRARLVSALAHVADDALLLGAATALLPCGALFSALAAAALLGSGLLGATAMAAYASITGLVVVGIAQLGALHVLGARLRRAVGVVLVGGAVMVGLRPLAMLRAAGTTPACHLVTHAHGTAR